MRDAASRETSRHKHINLLVVLRHALVQTIAVLLYAPCLVAHLLLLRRQIQLNILAVVEL